MQSPHRLTKDEVAEHLRQYATKFHLNVIPATVIHSSVFNTSEKKWTIKIRTMGGGETRTVICKQFVQATGLGCGKPYLPTMKDEQVYKGVSVHSLQFQNAHVLAGQGVKVRSMTFFAQHILITGDSGPTCPPSPFILVLTLAL
jgi:cation diffusion facilitator CzcD-associated flavoprotein CzcO